MWTIWYRLSSKIEFYQNHFRFRKPYRLVQVQFYVLLLNDWNILIEYINQQGILIKDNLPIMKCIIITLNIQKY